MVEEDAVGMTNVNAHLTRNESSPPAREEEEESASASASGSGSGSGPPRLSEREDNENDNQLESSVIINENVVGSQSSDGGAIITYESCVPCRVPTLLKTRIPP